MQNLDVKLCNTSFIMTICIRGGQNPEALKLGEKSGSYGEEDRAARKYRLKLLLAAFELPC